MGLNHTKLTNDSTIYINVKNRIDITDGIEIITKDNESFKLYKSNIHFTRMDDQIVNNVLLNISFNIEGSENIIENVFDIPIERIVHNIL